MRLITAHLCGFRGGFLSHKLLSGPKSWFPRQQSLSSAANSGGFLLLGSNICWVSGPKSSLVRQTNARSAANSGGFLLLGSNISWVPRPFQPRASKQREFRGQFWWFPRPRGSHMLVSAAKCSRCSQAAPKMRPGCSQNTPSACLEGLGARAYSTICTIIPIRCEAPCSWLPKKRPSLHR